MARPISLKTRLIRMQLLGAAIVLFLCSAGFIINDALTFKTSVENDLESTSLILGRNLASALVFSDQAEGAKILSSLESLPSISSAIVYDEKMRPFAQFGNYTGKAGFSHFISHHIIRNGSEIQGYVNLDADLKVFAEHYDNYLWICFFVISIGFIISIAVANLIQRSVSAPIVLLANTAKKISVSGNYSIRMPREHGKSALEIDTLASEFNQMLEQIQTKDEMIRSTNAELETMVEVRTKKLLEAQALLTHSGRLSALGEMAGGVAHEVNNPLAIIHTLSGQLQELVQDETIDRTLLADVSRQIETTALRISKIINGLRSFSRDGTNDPFQTVAVQQVVEDALALCGEKFKNHGIEIRTAPISESLIFDCRATQIGQVLLNLLNNAYDAIASLPTRWISIEVRDLAQEVEIFVTDSGGGIPEKIREKMFQPFFTTKELGKGTGLGLSISRGIVQSHGGSFGIDAECPNTRFVLRFPKRHRK